MELVMDAIILIGVFLYFYLVVWVANLAELRRQQQEPYQGLALISYLGVIFLYGAAFLIGLLVQSFGVLVATQPQLLESLGLENGANPFEQVESFTLLSMGIWLPALLGIVLLLPPVRRWVARFIPIDPANPVHAVALALVALILINLLVTLGIGLGTLTQMLEEQAADGAGHNTVFTLGATDPDGHLWPDWRRLAGAAQLGRNAGSIGHRHPHPAPGGDWGGASSGVGANGARRGICRQLFRGGGRP
jgi:hypothetical protein